MKKVTGWPSVKSEDTKALKAYRLFLRVCCKAMEELWYLEELNIPAKVNILIQNLLCKLWEKGRTKASDIFKWIGQRACFPDIVNFTDKQVRLISDPVFGNIQRNNQVNQVSNENTDEKKWLCNPRFC